MSLFRIMDVASMAMTAQSQRLNVVASNLANVESATSSSDQAYKAKHVLFQATPLVPGNATAVGVRTVQVVEDQSPGRMVFDPKHPLADEAGYIRMPNVNAVDEVANMISASRSYQTNVEMFNTAKQMVQRTLSLLQQ